MKDLKQFMFIFRYELNQEHQPTKEEQEKEEQLWGEFIGQIAAQEKLVSVNQLGFEGAMIFPNNTIENKIYNNEAEITGGNMIVNAENIEQACEMAKQCPIFQHSGTAEVRSILPM